MKRIISVIACVSAAVLALWCAPVAADRRAASIVVPILMYHHVGNWGPSRADWAPWVVLPEDFRAQMDWLVQHGYRTISFRELIECASRGVAPAGKPVIVSFDDGWAAQCGVVRDELMPRGMRATLFVYTGAVGPAPNGSGYVSWQELRELEAAGNEVQSHTVSHARLTDVLPAQLQVEMQESRRKIEAEMHHPVQALAYPFGLHDRAVMQAARAAGYECAVRADADVSVGEPLQFRMPRLRMGYGEGLQRFEECMLGSAVPALTNN
ncbi:MAG: polysaccharide deacetylase family protein [Planctomycetota bacterium]